MRNYIAWFLLLCRKGRYLQFTSEIVDLAVQVRDLHVSNISINIHYIRHCDIIYSCTFIISFSYPRQKRKICRICPLRNKVFICNMTILQYDNIQPNVLYTKNIWDIRIFRFTKESFSRNSCTIVILVYSKETSRIRIKTRISELMWTAWQSSHKQLIKKKRNRQVNQIVSACVLRCKSTGKREREKGVIRVEQAHRHSAGEPLDGSRLTVNWLAD